MEMGYFAQDLLDGSLLFRIVRECLTSQQRLLEIVKIFSQEHLQILQKQAKACRSP
jgi:hypothetical protein